MAPEEKMSKSISGKGIMRAPFMTSAMWFVWLLRSDVRGDAAFSDVAAQRSFIAWWMLWARSEYPAVFCWTTEHADIAMELESVANGLRCPRLLVRLYAARDDIRQAFAADNAEGLADYFCWYRLHGPRELAAAPPLPEYCIAVTEDASERWPWDQYDTRVPRIAAALYNYNPSFVNNDADAAQTARDLAAWYMTYGWAEVPKPTLPVSTCPTMGRKKHLRKGGVNLVGFVSAQSGLGEDLRMAAAGFDALQYPHVLLDVTGDCQHPLSETGRAIAVSDCPLYDTSIYCMSPFDMATFYLKFGPEFFARQYKIGYWPWEFDRFPDVWTDVYDLIDEIWTGSEFTAGAYRVNCSKPVLCLPAAVTVAEVQRQTLDLIDKRAFVFTYPFDPNSYLTRKNPFALVRAFRLAFPPEDRAAALLLRVNGVLREGPDRKALFDEIGDDLRIVVLEGSLDRVDALGLTASCDCLVSPHRAEGFGRNIGEAILLGIPVLATAYSGCTDFLAPNEGIAFDLTAVGAGQYPFAEGLPWAEPDIADMAAKMKRTRSVMRRNGPKERERLASRAARFAEVYAPQVTGRALVERLMGRQGTSPIRRSRRPAPIKGRDAGVENIRVGIETGGRGSNG